VIVVRLADSNDTSFLEEMLEAALQWNPGRPPLSAATVGAPENRRYVEGWPRAGDLGVVAVDDVDQRLVGAAWLRYFSENAPGYGFIDASIPEISIAVVPDHRGHGVGDRLLTELERHARERGITALSLSTEDGNPSVRLYERHGYRRVRCSGGSSTMRLDL